MKRKILNKLIDWKNTSNGKTALLIDGARRVGKSYITIEFAKKYYKSYILIDKFCTKYSEQIATPYVIHTLDYKEEDGIVYLPIYMTMFL